jgi:hypothetical protein
MGVVYKARQLRLKRLVAVKVMLAGACAGPVERGRFHTEAEAVARLAHPNVIQVFEVGEHDGRPFITLELCPGGSLERRLREAVFTPTDAAGLVRALAGAVHAAHQHQVLHRDLTPANVLFGEAGVPKITDFGLARKLDEPGQTQSGAVLGTPSYMAPEQADGRVREVGPAADVWALGAILYVCLTGRPPFRGPTVMDTLVQVLSDDPVGPRQLNPAVPRDLETVCLACLHKDPARRYASAQALADDLGRFEQGHPVAARRVGRVERLRRTVRRRPAVVLGLLLAAVTLASLGVGYRLWHDARRAAATRTTYHAWLLHPEDDPLLGPAVTQTVADRAGGWRVQYRGNRLVRIDALGRQGRLLRHNPYHRLTNKPPSDQMTLESSYRYTHDEDGRLRETAAHDRPGDLVWTLRAEGPNGRWAYTERYASPSTPVYLMVSGGGTSRTLLRGDGKGGLRVAGDPRTGAVSLAPLDGGAAAGGRVELQPLEGFGVRETTFDPAGRPVAGVGRVTGWPAERVFRVDVPGPDGLPDRRAGRVARWEARYNPDGTLAESSYWTLDERGRLVMTERKDGNDQVVESAAFSPEGKPILQRNGVHRVKSVYDAEGNTVEERYFDPDGKPAVNGEGFHHVASRYDERDNKVEEAYFGTDGRPFLRKPGYHRWIDRYDEKGRAVEGTNFGTDGKPVNRDDGFSRWTKTYGPDGRVREAAWWVATPPGGWAVKTRKNASDHLVEEAAFTRAGAPALFANGAHRVKYDRDAAGREVGTSFFGPDDRPCRGYGAFHRLTNTYNAKGVRVEVAYFGVDGKPSDVPAGFARLRQVLDAKGAVCDSEYFDARGVRLHTRLVVQAVTPRSLAERAGVRPGDALVRVNDRPVNTPAALNYQKAAGASGQTVVLLRDGKLRALRMNLGRAGFTVILVVLGKGRP